MKNKEQILIALKQLKSEICKEEVLIWLNLSGIEYEFWDDIDCYIFYLENCKGI
jgi:hypothetical protein